MTPAVHGGRAWTTIRILSWEDAVGGDQLSNLRVRGSSKFPWRSVRPTADWPRAVAGIKLAWRLPMGLVGCLWCERTAASPRATVSRWKSQVAAFECGSWLAVWMARRTTCSSSTVWPPQRQGGLPTSRPDRTAGGEVPADSPVLADTATLDPVEVGWLAVN
jgi:hypothetical protein